MAHRIFWKSIATLMIWLGIVLVLLAFIISDSVDFRFGFVGIGLIGATGAIYFLMRTGHIRIQGGQERSFAFYESASWVLAGAGLLIAAPLIYNLVQVAKIITSEKIGYLPLLVATAMIAAIPLATTITMVTTAFILRYRLGNDK